MPQQTMSECTTINAEHVCIELGICMPRLHGYFHMQGYSIPFSRIGPPITNDDDSDEVPFSTMLKKVYQK